jgi:hypothetical protein
MFAMAPDLSVNTEAPLAALRACRGSRVTLSLGALAAQTSRTGLPSGIPTFPALIDSVKTVVIGGQAGLAMSYHLSQRGRENIVIERARVSGVSG